jgi:DNA-binding transcriptional ArsR family regulator
VAKSDSPTDHSVECANYLKALADPIRLQIVRALQSGPMSVSDLSMLLDSGDGKRFPSFAGDVPR